MIWDTILFAIFPYIALALCIAVTFSRLRYRPFSVSSMSSQLLENRRLFWSSIPWHYGILLVLAGHTVSLVLPGLLQLWYSGSPSRLYATEMFGLALGLWALVGVLLLSWRRLGSQRLLATSTSMDLVLLALLLFQAITGVLIATVYRFGSLWFTAVFTPYLTSVLTLQPNVALLTPLPWVIKLHALNFFVLLALLPFSRLIHIVAYPLRYLWRPVQIVIWNRKGKAAGGPAAAGPTAGGPPQLQTPQSIAVPGVRGRARDGLTGATLGFFFGFAAVALFGPTANKVNELLRLSPVTLGFLVAMPSLSGSLLRIPFAAWVDSVGGRKPFLVLLGISIAGMAGLTVLMFALYPNGFGPGLLPVLFLLGLMCGCGIAIFSVGTGQVSYWFPKSQQGSALGTYAGIGNLAPGIFSFLLPIALLQLGMAGSYLAWLLFLVAGTALYFLLGRNAPYFQLLAQGLPENRARALAAQAGQQLFPSGKIKESLARSARTPRTWLLVVIYFTTFGGFLALTSWLPTYWRATFGLDAVLAGTLTALYSVLASLVRIAGGKVSDRIGGEWTLLVALGTTAVGAVMMAVSDQPGLSLAAEIVMALGMGVSNAAVFKLVPQAVPQAVGGVSGWVGGIGAFGGFTIPPVLGAIVAAQGAAGYASGFVVFIFLALLSLGLAVTFKLPAPAGRRAGHAI